MGLRKRAVYADDGYRMESYHTARELIREMAFEEGIPVEDLLKSEYLATSDIELFRKVKTCWAWRSSGWSSVLTHWTVDDLRQPGNFQ